MDLNDDGRQDSMEVRIDSEFIGVESLSTSAGSFAEAHRVRTQITFTLLLAGSTVPVLVEQTSEDWYATGVGPVRRTLSSRTGNGVPEVSSEELIAYKVGARRSEQASPAINLAKPANDSLSRPDIHVEIEFSRPIDPLSLIGDAGLRLLRDGQPMTLTSLTMTDEARSLRIGTRDYPLPDGQYELRHTGQASDWAGNLLPDVLLRFKVDTQGPRLVSSSPANGAEQAPRSGRIEFLFNEALRKPEGVNAVLVVRAETGNQEWLIPATVTGRTVFADLPEELRINSLYDAYIRGPLTDEQGNVFASPSIRFRTDPGPFSRPESWWPQSTNVAVAAADMNGDGRADLLGFGQMLGSNTYRLVLRTQRAGGGFEPLRELHSLEAIGLCGRSFAVADVNQDGRLDVVLPEACGPEGSHILLLQRADGSFEGETVPRLNPSGYWTGQSIVLASGGSALVWYGSNGLELWQREGSGRWRLSDAQPGGKNLSGVEVADLNGDGCQDLIWLQVNASEDGVNVVWSLQGASGDWSPVRSKTQPVFWLSSVLAVDLNQDRRIDLVLSGATVDNTPTVVVLRANPSGDFDLSQQLTHASRSGGVAAGDLDGDGRLDLVLAEELHRTGVYLQTATGDFDPRRSFEADFGYASDVKSVALLDLNGDGRLDIVQRNVVLYGRPMAGSWPRGLSAPTRSGSRMSVLRAMSSRAAERR